MKYLSKAVVLCVLAAFCSAVLAGEAEKPKAAVGTVTEKGLCVTVKAAKDKFAGNDMLTFEVTFKNVSDKAMRVYDAGYWMYELNDAEKTWHAVFRNVDTKKEYTPRFLVRPMMARIGQPVELAAGAEHLTKMTLPRNTNCPEAGAAAPQPGPGVGRVRMPANVPLPEGKYCLVLTLELKDGKGIELMADDKPSQTPFWVGTVKLESAAFEIGAAVAAVQPPVQVGPGVVTSPPQGGAAGWQKVFEDEQWYKQQKGDEQEFTGVLKAIPQDANVATTLQRPSLYSLGDRTIYTGAKKVDALDKLVNRNVTIRGKAVDMELEGQALKELWPGAVRPAAMVLPVDRNRVMHTLPVEKPEER